MNVYDKMQSPQKLIHIFNHVKDQCMFVCAAACRALTVNPTMGRIVHQAHAIDVDKDTPFKWFYDILDPDEYWYNEGSDETVMATPRMAYMRMKNTIQESVRE